MRLTYVGHATAALEVAGTVVVVDPVLRRRVAFLRWHGPAPDADVMRAVDAVLVTHLHHDHCDLRSLRSLGDARTLLVPGDTGGFFRRHGFADAVPVRPGVTQQLDAVSVTATPAAHDGRRLPLGPRRGAVGYVVDGGGLRLYVAGDTGLFDEMAELGPLDVALVPVAGWGRSLGPGHLDPVGAAEAVRRLRPTVAVPIHWGTLRPVWHRRPGPSQTDAPALAFSGEVRWRGLPTTVTVLQPGESLTLTGGSDRG